MLPDKMPIDPVTPTAEPDEDSAKKFINLVLLAFKNFCLYPATHFICHNCLNQLKTAMETVCADGKPFRWEIEKDGILFHGRPLYRRHSKSPGENLPGILYRDGVRWIAFNPDADTAELSRFFQILHTYRYLDDEPEGDLVTALWEAGFRSIEYKAVLHWEEAPLLRFPSLDSADNPLKGSRQLIRMLENKSLPRAEEGADPIPLDEMRPEEVRQLREMIAEQEAWDAEPEIMESLLDMLEREDHPEFFTTVLEFLEEEYLHALENRSFGFAADLVDQIQALRVQLVDEKPWSAPRFDAFLEFVSGRGAMSALRGTLIDHSAALSDSVSVELKALLHRLKPAVVNFLVPMLLETDSPRLQRILMEQAVYLLNRDLQAAEPLLQAREPDRVRMTVHILGYLKWKKVEPIMFRMIRHSAARVRKQALKWLIVNKPDRIEGYFSLIDDPNPSIRHLVLNHIMNRRLSSAEPLLLDYLQKETYFRHGKDHVMTCHIALGHCATGHSIPLLKSVLLNRSWAGLFGGKHAHARQSAARALSAMKDEEARAVLLQAARSLFPHIRKPAKSVEKSDHVG